MCYDFTELFEFFQQLFNISIFLDASDEKRGNAQICWWFWGLGFIFNLLQDLGSNWVVNAMVSLLDPVLD